jgi:hypothetical protein
MRKQISALIDLGQVQHLTQDLLNKSLKVTEGGSYFLPLFVDYRVRLKFFPSKVMPPSEVALPIRWRLRILDVIFHMFGHLGAYDACVQEPLPHGISRSFSLMNPLRI